MTTLGRRVALLGAAATPIGRLVPKTGLYPGFEQDILAPVVFDALADAGVANVQVQSAVFAAPTPATRQLGFAPFMAAQLGLRCTSQFCEVSSLGMTGGTAFDQAHADVALGRSDCALALGIAMSTNANMADIVDNGIRAVGDVDFQAPFGVTPISWYAFDAARYMHETGTTRAQLAAVAAKNRAHACMNPLAQYRKPLSVEEVLTARMVVEPLGLLDVPPIGDGAICLVLTSLDMAARSGKPYVEIAGRGFGHDGFHQVGDVPHDITAYPAAKQAAGVALSEAGLNLDGVDFAELYAPCTITEILVSEAIGAFGRGAGGIAAAEGQTKIGGKFPINTSGGCLSRGHPPSITGLYGLLEVREQLLWRAGERQVSGAQAALHICELGNYNAALAHVLRRVQ